MHFSNRTNIPPSATLSINALAQKKKAAGKRVYNLSAGEALVAGDPRVLAAGHEAMKAGKTRYVPTGGVPELREAAQSWFNRSYTCTYSLEETMIMNGSKYALYALCQALLNPGDEALVLAPYWVSYPSMIRLAEGSPVIVETGEEDGWKVSPDDIASLCKEKTRFLILNNGANPTGVLYSREELETILSIAAEKDILVIADEPYSGLTYDGADYVSCGSFEAHKDRIIVTHSCSKNFAMTGWRIGMVFAPKEIIAVLKRIQGQSTSGPSSISQWAAIAALEHADDITKNVQTALQQRRDHFCQEFERHFGMALPLPPSGLYYFIPISAFGVDEHDSVAFCTRALEEAHVAMVPGAAFGCDGYVRCSFGVEESEIEAALFALKQYLSSASV